MEKQHGEGEAPQHQQDEQHSHVDHPFRELVLEVEQVEQRDRVQ
jgi:hypothetical protein